MKILCVIDSLGSGGAQRQITKLAVEFKKSGNEVEFLIYHPIYFYKGILDENNIKVHCIEEKKYFQRFLKIRKHIRSGNYDTILSFLSGANFMCELSSLPFKKWKLVVGERSANPNILQSKKLKLLRLFHLCADYVVANSHENMIMVKKINPFLSKEKCRVIYNLVSIEKENHISSERFSKTKISVVGSYRKVKNLDGLIKALNMLSPEDKSQLQMEWYGNKSIDNNSHEIIKQAEEKIQKYKIGNILKLNNETSEIQKIYQNSDFIALFSHYEGLPNTICEAMMLGKPVIVTKVSDIPLIIKERENGLLCDSNDVKSIADAISKAIHMNLSERESIGASNEIKAKKLFDKNEVVNAYLNLFK